MHRPRPRKIVDGHLKTGLFATDGRQDFLKPFLFLPDIPDHPLFYYSIIPLRRPIIHRRTES